MVARTPRRPLVAGIAVIALLAPPVFAGESDDTEPVIIVEGFDVDPPPSDDFGAALACWRRLVRVNTASTEGAKNARGAIDRFFSTARGRGVIIELCELLIDGRENRRGAELEIIFVDSLLPECSDSADGCFLPAIPGADRYELFVQTQSSDAATEPTQFVFGEYPGNPDCGVLTFYEKATSSMAHTMYHELLHVWFLNAHAGEDRRYPTGHGAVNRCEFEDGFLEALSAHAYELAVLEGSQPPPFLRIQEPQP
jgi:hypothetical protein